MVKNGYFRAKWAFRAQFVVGRSTAHLRVHRDQRKAQGEHVAACGWSSGGAGHGAIITACTPPWTTRLATWHAAIGRSQLPRGHGAHAAGVGHAATSNLPSPPTRSSALDTWRALVNPSAHSADSGAVIVASGLSRTQEKLLEKPARRSPSFTK